MKLDAKIPAGDIRQKWDNHKFQMKLVNPANKRKYHVICVGTGLAGASASASMAELGYQVSTFCFQDSPRRAHSIAAQGGINAAKNYRNDGDSIWRLFYDTVKGGDYRAREANVYRLAQVSVNIIDQCVAQGVPFAREYSGLLDNRSFGGAQVSRTFYAKGQTGQQLLIGAYQALERQIAEGNVKMYPRTEMLDLIVIDGKARGVTMRNLVTGEITTHIADAVVLATGGYGNVFYLSTNAKGSNVTATYRAYKKGAGFANPCFTQIHPTCIPVSGDYQSKLTLMSESLRNDGRIWVPKKQNDTRHPNEIPESERDYYLERRYPAFGNLVPRDVASRAAKERCDAGFGVGPTKLGVYLDFKDAIARLGKDAIAERYGNLFDMYFKITDENPYERPMRIYPAIHYTMGGLWVDYNLMSNIDGLFVIGEANFSDHGANRLGASALMQGLADGYFVLPYTIGHYFANTPQTKIDNGHLEIQRSVADVKARINKFLSIKGKQTVDSFHKRLGHIMWDNCGMSRTKESLLDAMKKIPALREEFWSDVSVTGTGEELNQNLEKAGRVADFLEFGELLIRDALTREESCGGHFREEYQTEDGEAKRDDEHFAHASVWEYKGDNQEPVLHKEKTRIRACEAFAKELQVNLTLKVWRQASAKAKGEFQEIKADNISEHASFLEMLDVVNEKLETQGKTPIAFDHDCREGICGSCSLMIDGCAHGPEKGTTACQLHMRHFKDGQTIVIEPWRAKAFPVIKDLCVDRSAFDRVIQAGGYVSVSTGGVPDANSILVGKDNADKAFNAAACIGCGACVAQCKNASANLFVSAKITHLGLLPQGQVEAKTRVWNMVEQMDKEGFGACTNTGDCEAVCPKEIKMNNIHFMNRSFIKSFLTKDK